MRRFAHIGLAVLLLCASIFAQFRAGKKSDEPPQPRTLAGTVLDQDNHAVPGAIVYLKNMRNLAVSTYIAGDDGSYRFVNLSPDADYQVRAESEGHKSPARPLSSFDTHKQAHIDLRLGK